MKYYFGIDFGTTNSAVVAIVYDKDWNRTITFGDEYENPFPSLIAIDKSDGKVCKKYIKEFEALNSQYFKTKVLKYIYMRPTERVWVVSVDNMYNTYKVFRNQQTAQDYYTDLLLYYPSAKVRIYCEGEETMDNRPFRKSF